MKVKRFKLGEKVVCKLRNEQFNGKIIKIVETHSGPQYYINKEKTDELAFFPAAFLTKAITSRSKL